MNKSYSCSTKRWGFNTSCVREMLLQRSSASFSSEFDGFSAEGKTFGPESTNTRELIELNQFANVYMGWDLGFSTPSLVLVKLLTDISRYYMLKSTAKKTLILKYGI
jgi:hypothetical protein